jgi:hypothetical protein
MIPSSVRVPICPALTCASPPKQTENTSKRHFWVFPKRASGSGQNLCPATNPKASSILCCPLFQTSFTHFSLSRKPHNRHHDHFQGAYPPVLRGNLPARIPRSHLRAPAYPANIRLFCWPHFADTRSRTSSPTTRSSPTPTTSRRSTVSSTRPTARRSPSVVRPSVCSDPQNTVTQGGALTRCRHWCQRLR